MTTTVMMHAPASAPYAGFTNVNGRKYTAAAGSPLLVPDYDANPLEAAGWTRAGDGGTTAQRPANPARNYRYQDTTVGGEIIWDGKTWRHATTGTAV